MYEVREYTTGAMDYNVVIVVSSADYAKYLLLQQYPELIPYSGVYIFKQDLDYFSGVTDDTSTTNYYEVVNI